MITVADIAYREGEIKNKNICPELDSNQVPKILKCNMQKHAALTTRLFGGWGGCGREWGWGWEWGVGLGEVERMGVGKWMGVEVVSGGWDSGGVRYGLG